MSTCPSDPISPTRVRARQSSVLLLADPRLRSRLARVPARRVHANDVEDLVQTVLAEAFCSADCPDTEEEVRRFVFAIARQRAIDLHRRRDRELRRVLPEIEPAQPLGPTRDLLRWAEGALPPAPDARQTFDWMLRESEGDTLADIATAFTNRRMQNFVVPDWYSSTAATR